MIKPHTLVTFLKESRNKIGTFYVLYSRGPIVRCGIGQWQRDQIKRRKAWKMCVMSITEVFANSLYFAMTMNS
jgi:hypothetical protein